MAIHMDPQEAQGAPQAYCQLQTETDLNGNELSNAEIDSGVFTSSSGKSEAILSNQSSSRNSYRFSQVSQAKAPYHTWFSAHRLRGHSDRGCESHKLHQRIIATSTPLHSLPSLPSHVIPLSSLSSSSPSSSPSSSSSSTFSSPKNYPSPSHSNAASSVPSPLWTTRTMTQIPLSRRVLLQEENHTALNISRQHISSQSPRDQISSQSSHPNTRQQTLSQAPRLQNASPASHHPAALIAPWKQWESVAVNLFDLPPEIDAYTLWKAFNKEGRVFSIDIFEDIHANKGPRGKLRFKPPPREDFWRTRTYPIELRNRATKLISVTLDSKRPENQVQSPVRPSILYPAEVVIPIVSMDIGVQINETIMSPMRTVGGGRDGHIHAVLDLKRKDLFIFFQLPIFNYGHRPASTNKIYNQYRLRIPFVQLTKLHHLQDAQSGVTSHLTFLDMPAIYHRRIQETRGTFTDDISWRDMDSWYRQTSIVHNPSELSVLPVSLKRLKPVIDIGRWNAFRITYPTNISEKNIFVLFCNVLRDYNISITEKNSFSVLDHSRENPPSIWNWIDYTESQMSRALSSLEELIDETYVHLSFPVRYQLEVCISHNYLSEFTMTREFAIKLSGLGEAEALKLLEHVATKKEIFHDPMKIFDLKFVKGVTHAKIPSYCCYMRSARITPTTIYYNTPSVDISNRVIRHYIEFADRFLRVRFTDEKLLGRINSTMDNTMDEVFTRIKRALANGIIVGDRRYEFLAFGNSQFREHGAYFFAPLPNLTAANIRAWMGTFSDIRNIAKHAARLGQCFSTTRAIAGCPVEIHQIDDVVKNGYTFSDGVGRISRFLAQMAASELKMKTPTDEPPSAFQFRLGGCKGMLTVSPEAQRREVHIRKSQYKFAAIHNGLEIIRWSQFSMASLNRQLIIVLSSLGISDQIFHKKLKSMLHSLNEAMESDPQAIYWLRKYVDPNQMTLTVSQIVLDGFRRTREPFVTSILQLWRAWHLKYLKEKAKIVIDKGANLLGCMDETGILKGYFERNPNKDASSEEKLASLPEVFVQVYHPESGKYQVIEDVCILARNPSLHPGDIRVVRAVNVPELNHLKDVVIFPQTGDRDVPSMCSGGDLDGDDYLVIWDQDLIPKEWFLVPMKYPSDKAQDLDQDVTVDHITSFFVTYMKNDFLPKIAHAHLAWADRLENGVNESKCIQLAQLHSDAVDYNKTGKPAHMTRNLQPKMWPHFMEKKHKPKERIYRSAKILGQLYDAVERVDFVPSLEMPFDERILKCRLEVTDGLMQTARDLKIDYDASMRRIMAQHEIKTEFEIWSTFVLSHANLSQDYKFHEEMGLISLSLRDTYRKKCYEQVGGHSFGLLAPLAVAMYRVTHEEMTTALQKYNAENPHEEKLFHKPTPEIEQLPLISFPWILHNILGKVAMGLYDEAEPVVSPVPASTAATKCAEIDSPEANPNEPASNAWEDPSSAQAAQVPPKSIYADPFGLFEGDMESGPPPHLATVVTKNSTEDRCERILSLDQLLDFGLMEFAVPPTCAQKEESPVDISSPEGEGISLLELGDGSENIKPGQVDIGNLEPDITVSKGGCIDIMEEEDEIQPTALDTLYEILNS